jgi:two-component system sensor histidine kinase UhpB
LKSGEEGHQRPSKEQRRLRQRDLERHLRREGINEAQQLAAELHDGLGQELAGISLLVSALRRAPAAQHPEVQESLENIAGLMVQAMVSCRRVSEGYGGFLVRQHGLTAALLHFASQFDDDHIHIKFHGREIPAHWLDETTAYYLFGIGREAFCNAIRHSHAKTIELTCDHDDGIVRLIVEDDGVGLSETAGPEARGSRQAHGIGRSIMEFRARSIGADLTFTPVAAGGLRVECSIACHPDDDDHPA